MKGQNKRNLQKPLRDLAKTTTQHIRRQVFIQPEQYKEMKGDKISAVIQVTHEKNPMPQLDAVLIHICFFLIKRPNEP